MATAWTDPTQALGNEMNTDDLVQLSRARSQAMAGSPQTFETGGEVKAADGGEVSELLQSLRNSLRSAPIDPDSVLRNSDSRAANFSNYLREPTLPEVHRDLNAYYDENDDDYDRRAIDRMIESADDYMGTGAFDLNRLLRTREEGEDLPEHYDRMSNNLSDLISTWGGVRSPLALYRGLSLPTGADIDQLFHDPAYQSWSANPITAKEFSNPFANGYGKRSILLARNVEPGESAIALKTAQPKSLTHEMEVLLPPQNYRPQGKTQTVRTKNGFEIPMFRVKPYAAGGEVDPGDSTASLQRLAEMEKNHPLLKRYTSKLAENFMGLDPMGHVSFLRERMPGFIDQFISSAGGMEQLARLAAEHLGMGDNPIDKYITGPVTSDADARLASLRAQISHAMDVPEQAHGWGENVADAAGYLTGPVSTESLGLRGAKSGLKTLMEFAGARPASLSRFAGDSAAFGTIGDAPDLLQKLHGLSDRYASSDEQPDVESEGTPGDDRGSPGYGEGGEVDALRRLFLKYLAAGAVAATPAARMIDKVVGDAGKEAPKAAEAFKDVPLAHNELHPNTFNALHDALFGESDEPDWDRAMVIMDHIPPSAKRDVLQGHLANFQSALEDTTGIENLNQHTLDSRIALGELAAHHGMPLAGDEDFGFGEE